ncbi:TPA: hypothetical protein N0F65_007256 [Lagenidium giganteum]|uniref:Ion transport domain-containing protein n=1 Tax=Lagenidium giganteum TaxID=4803 RepID=A0AAV2YV77_9STRA|nr:TPA: hypothetical protein N0F65_007256 [Lagenidium giganteum]
MKWVSPYNDDDTPLKVLSNGIKFLVWVLLSLRSVYDPYDEDVRPVVIPVQRRRWYSITRYGQKFGRSMFVSESLMFVVLLVSTYWSFISSRAHAGRVVSIITACIFLLLEILDWTRRRWAYFRDVINWINLAAYIGIFIIGFYSQVDPTSELTALGQAILIVLLSFCGLEYLRMVPLTSLLIAVTFKMVNDVVKFIVLYGVFQVGFSGSFYLLFHDEGSRYDTYSEAFLATFLMLFGDIDSDLFFRLTGAKALVASILVLMYLIGAMVMLMNLLIAMMSTSYQQVVDGAKVARSIGRAEIILRMESLLPQHIREHMFKCCFRDHTNVERVQKRMQNMANIAKSDVSQATNAPSPLQAKFGENRDALSTDDTWNDLAAGNNSSKKTKNPPTKKTLKELRVAGKNKYLGRIFFEAVEAKRRGLDDCKCYEVVEG